MCFPSMNGIFLRSILSRLQVYFEVSVLSSWALNSTVNRCIYPLWEQVMWILKIPFSLSELNAKMLTYFQDSHLKEKLNTPCRRSLEFRPKTITNFRPSKSQNLYPVLDQRILKTLLFGTAYACNTQVSEYPPPSPRGSRYHWSYGIADWLLRRLIHL